VKLADANEGDRVEDVGIMVDVGRNREPGELRDGTGPEVRKASDCDLDCRLPPLDEPMKDPSTDGAEKR
jgi:hypothetical protein